MIKNKLLTTEDIKAMTLSQFVHYKAEFSPYKSFNAQELMEANINWLLIDELEHVKTKKDLFKIIRELKEDLWFDIQRRQR